jgi:hypothetical protein
VENIMRVVKENGFTSYNTDVDHAWYKSTTPGANRRLSSCVSTMQKRNWYKF